MPLNKISQAIRLIQQIAPSVTRPEAEKLAPVLINQNNQEPWYRSRVTWGAVAAILSGLATIITQITGGDPNLEVIFAAITAIGGGITTIWGRWGAKAPIGQ